MPQGHAPTKQGEVATAHDFGEESPNSGHSAQAPHGKRRIGDAHSGFLPGAFFHATRLHARTQVDVWPGGITCRHRRMYSLSSSLANGGILRCVG